MRHSFTGASPASSSPAWTAVYTSSVYLDQEKPAELYPLLPLANSVGWNFKSFSAWPNGHADKSDPAAGTCSPSDLPRTPSENKTV